MKKFLISRRQIDSCVQPKAWDLGNKVLYDLCAKNFTHNSTEEILAKTLLIGRTYAAAIDRRKNKTDINDNFYIKTVIPTFKKSKIDRLLGELKSKKLSIDTAPLLIFTHSYLTNLLSGITEQGKRSFSSKYLHFHLPNLFFLYDSRAMSVIGLYVKRVPKHLAELIDIKKSDKIYVNFFYKCLHLRHAIFERHNIWLKPRQLDNFLIEAANHKLGLAYSSKRKAGS